MCNKLTSNALILLSLIVLSLTGAASTAAEWGSLKGRFVVDGKPPEPKPLVVDKDEFCIQAKPMSKELVLGKDNSLVNAVVYLRVPRRGKVDVHPDYAAQLGEPAVLDNHNCSFEPHITLVSVGQTLLIKNSDPTGHNTNLGALFGFNQIIPAGQEAPVKVAKDAPLPQPVTCNIHPFMQGYVLSQDHPYMVLSGDDGTFELINLPVGKHEFQFWHEAPGYLKDLKFKDGKTDRQGRIELTIAAGKSLDLGDIKVPASMLK